MISLMIDDGLDAGVEAALDILLRVGCRNSLEEIVRQRECIQTTSGNTLKTMSVDNYSEIRLTDFATSWNNWVDTLGHSKPTVTHKCQSLQEAYKTMKSRVVEAATLRPHTKAIHSAPARITGIMFIAVIFNNVAYV